ncbi:hypothetical protein EFY87_17895 [Flexivirga caeni]|uniref:N-acetyltransferase domain-containing protein n=1 Tax=Flexivirga caeni TaxID=2294115 RepID=A0A3M9LYG4_9MICO|nr:hypothetical protein EFY87_17895 [Flexivirga caeni]
MLAASEAVDRAWLPPNIDAVQTDDYLVICRPTHLTSTTSGRVHAWITSDRPFAEVRTEVERFARARGTHDVWWRAERRAEPDATESLRSAGATVVLTELVMARPLTEVDTHDQQNCGTPPGVSTNVVASKEEFTALARLEAEGWGRPAPTSDTMTQDWATLRAGLESSSEFAMLATVEGSPAAVARCAVFGSVVRLFGAVTIPAFRRRGLYRSLVTARCELGHAKGATMALTKARQETSAPILEGMGFRSYAFERCWRLQFGEG